jgi:hypothetical protein
MPLSIGNWLIEKDPYIGYRYQLPINRIDWMEWTSGNDIDLSGQNQMFSDPDADLIRLRIGQDGGTVVNDAQLNEAISLLKGLGLWSDVLYFGNSQLGLKVADAKCATLYDLSNGVDNSTDLAQTDPDLMPAYTSTQIVFDNVDDTLTGNTGFRSILNNKSAVSVFMLFAPADFWNAEVHEYLFIGQGTANARLSMEIVLGFVTTAANVDGDSPDAANPTRYLLAKSTLATSVIDFVGGTIDSYYDGISKTTFSDLFTTGQNTSNTPAYSAGFAVNSPANAGLTSMLIIEGVLSDANRAIIEAHMIARWGVPMTVQNPITVSRSGHMPFIFETPQTMQSISITSPLENDDIGNWITDAHMIRYYEGGDEFWDGTFADYFYPNYMYTYSGAIENGTVTLEWNIVPTSVATPVFDPVDTTSLKIATDTVTITCATGGATITYRVKYGAGAWGAWTEYSAPFTLSTLGAAALEAKATFGGLPDSETAAVGYTVTVIGTVATPEMDITAGNYVVAQSVSITCATSGAAIYYTTNGATPTTGDTLYTGAITINTDTTLKAKAFKTNYTDSATASEAYDMVAPNAPTATAASSVLDISMTANWGAETGATSYRLDVSAVSNFATFVAGYEDKTVSGTSDSVTGLSENVTYYYRVRAVGIGGTSASSNTITQATVYNPLMSFTAGTNDNISELRITLANNDTVTCSGGITICGTAGGVYGASLALNSGDRSAFIKRTDSGTTGYLYLTTGNVTKYGTANAGSGTGYRYSTGGSEAGTPNSTLYLAKFASAATQFTHYIATTSVTVTLSGALPSGLTGLYLEGVNISYSFSSALPTGLTYCWIFGNNIAWTSTDALPTGITTLNLYGSQLSWTYNGALPTGITYLKLQSNGLAWTYNGALPSGLTQVLLDSSSMTWTGLSIPGSSTMALLNLSNFFATGTTKMSAANVSTLLQSIDGRTAAQLPATGTIGDVPDMRDTNQGGIWGTFTGTPANDTPTALAIALKSVYVTKVMVLTLNTWQCVVPAASGDGTGFPQYFGDWWRA